MINRKVCVVSGSRADYGLLYWLLKEINVDQEMDLQLIVTGMHLSSDFGLTFKEIEKDFLINIKIDMRLESDSDLAIIESMSRAQKDFSKAYKQLMPDIIVVLGDRYEIFSAATSAMISRIPIAHLHGGEATEGLIDEAIRHSISKMSHLHFVASEEYRKRVIQLGENPNTVFNYGALGIDNIKKIKLLSLIEFEKSINFKLNTKNILVTYHPVTLENASSEKHFRALLSVIEKLINTNIIFTKSNSDHDGRIINDMIDDFVFKNKNCISFHSMGQLHYLSALKFVDAIVGNSSSGLIEAPSFKIGTINIGDRQKGRIKAKSVIDCSPDSMSITTAFETLYSISFQRKLSEVKNPFGEGGASKRIKEKIKNFNLSNVLKKPFYDLEPVKK